MMTGTHASWGRRLAPLSIAAGLAVASTQAVASAQQPTFTAAVDLIAVDAHVIDSDGNPASSLGPANFEVSINGRRRRVVSAHFIQTTTVAALATPAPVARGPQASNIWPTTDAAGRGRTYVLAFDMDSLSIQASRDIVAAARGFIQRLQPADTVGLHAWPGGPRVQPTLDHARVSQAVDRLVGRSQTMSGVFNLTPSEIVDINSELVRAPSAPTAGAPAPVVPAAGTTAGFAAALLDVGEGSTLRRIQLRECGTGSAACGDAIRAEAATRAHQFEIRAKESLNDLRSLIGLLNEQPGRKTVVLFSAGMPVSDRAGARADVGNLARALGQDAATTNATIYTVYVDNRQLRTDSAEARRGGSTRTPSDRDVTIGTRLLGEFSGTSGGAVLHAATDGGQLALDRVLRETSSHYLLAVEPAADDRDGKPRELRVRAVNARGLTIRSRSWVVVPRS